MKSAAATCKSIFAASAIAMFALPTGLALAQNAPTEAPTNAQLFDMFKQLQQKQNALAQEATQAKAEAEKAKKELAAANQALKEARQKIASIETDVTSVRDAQATVASAPLPPAPGNSGTYGFLPPPTMPAGPTVSASIGYNQLVLPTIEFTAFLNNNGERIEEVFTDEDGNLDGYQLDVSLDRIASLGPNLFLGAKAYYGKADSTQTRQCADPDSSDVCTTAVIIDLDPNAQQFYEADAALTTVNRDVQTFGAALEVASAASGIINFSSGVAIRGIFQDTGIISLSDENDTVVYNEDLDTLYYGGYVGVTASNDSESGFFWLTGATFGVYNADVDYEGRLVLDTGAAGNLSLSEDELTFILSGQVETGYDFGRARLSAFARGEWYSYVPKMVYQNVDFDNPGNFPGNNFGQGGAEQSTRITEGDAVSLTVGGKITVPFGNGQ